MGSCAGTEGAAIFGCALLSESLLARSSLSPRPWSDSGPALLAASYLFLFIAFYKATYKQQGAARAAKTAAASVAKKTN